MYLSTNCANIPTKTSVQMQATADIVPPLKDRLSGTAALLCVTGQLKTSQEVFARKTASSYEISAVTTCRAKMCMKMC